MCENADFIRNEIGGDSRYLIMVKVVEYIFSGERCIVVSSALDFHSF